MIGWDQVGSGEVKTSQLLLSDVYGSSLIGVGRVGMKVGGVGEFG